MLQDCDRVRAVCASVVDIVAPYAVAATQPVALVFEDLSLGQLGYIEVARVSLAGELPSMPVLVIRHIFAIQRVERRRILRLATRAQRRLALRGPPMPTT